MGVGFKLDCITRRGKFDLTGKGGGGTRVPYPLMKEIILNAEGKELRRRFVHEETALLHIDKK